MVNGGSLHEEPIKGEDRKKGKPAKKPAGKRGVKTGKRA